MAEDKKKNLRLPKTTKKKSNKSDKTLGLSPEFWALIGAILLVLLIVFILMGGINQRKFIESMIEFGNKIGTSIRDWFAGTDLTVESDGIKWTP